MGEGVSELRVNFGPGYRVYFVQKTHTYVVLLAGGDKSTQDSDIVQAKALARNLQVEAKESTHAQDNDRSLGPSRAP